jgi:LacI family fructose operon transcriptional repressor
VNEIYAFYPPKRAGMIFHLSAIALLTLLGAAGFWQAMHADVGPVFLLYLLPFLIALPLVPFLIFRLNNLENASYARLAKLLEQGARARGYQLLIAGSGDDPDTERELARSLKARRCDALIVASALPPNDPFYQELQQEDLPVIAVDRSQSPGVISCVVSDNRKGAATLARSVLEPGTGSVVWLDAVPALAMTRERREGFEEVARSRSGQWAVYSGEHYDRASGARLMQRVLADQGLPDALITASYTLLQGVLDVLLEQPGGLPQSLRMATFGDDRLLDFLPVKVHSLPQKHEAIAKIFQ